MWAYNDDVIINLHINLTLIGVLYLPQGENLLTVAPAEWKL